MDYDLSHLTQDPDQKVLGPIQDDEALLLFALIRVMVLRRVLEIGGLGGYSATNFAAAVGPAGTVYSVDVNPVPKVADNHVPITMDVGDLRAADVGSIPLDLVFFDCHCFVGQMAMLTRFVRDGVITDRTVIALHDTNLHPGKTEEKTYEVTGGWVNCWPERRMVNEIRELGYDAICLDTDMSVHGPDLPFRHGLTLMRRFTTLTV